jgi:hypothetical protein
MKFMEANPLNSSSASAIAFAWSTGAARCGLAGAAHVRPALTVLEPGARLDPEPAMGAERGGEEGWGRSRRPPGKPHEVEAPEPEVKKHAAVDASLSSFPRPD